MGCKAQNIFSPSCGQILHWVWLGLRVNSSWQIYEKTRPRPKPTGSLEPHCQIKGSTARSTHTCPLSVRRRGQNADLKSLLGLLRSPHFLNNHIDYPSPQIPSVCYHRFTSMSDSHPHLYPFLTTRHFANKCLKDLRQMLRAWGSLP